MKALAFYCASAIIGAGRYNIVEKDGLVKPIERKRIEAALRLAEELIATLQRVLDNSPKSTKEKPEQKFKSWDMQASKYLNETLKVNIKGWRSRRDDELENWANDFRKLREIDGYQEDEIAEVLKWTVHDSFWKMNIRSGSKFREKYETLNARMQTTTDSRPTIL